MAGMLTVIPWFRACLAIIIFLSVYLVKAAVLADSRCPTGFVNMGDSLTDTGNALNAFPFVADAESSPYGDTFFRAPAKRFSDGRLVPDFFSLAFHLPLLDSYFATTAFNYGHGVNFAVAGATAAPSSKAVTPFSLTYQVNQFIRFINSAKVTAVEPACGNFQPNLPQASTCSNWLYTLEIGGNDILGALNNGVSTAEITSSVIPAAVKNVAAAIQTLYGATARQFLIFGIPAQGCSTIVLTLFGNLGLPTDSLGCIVPMNQLVQTFNEALLAGIQDLRQALPGTIISYFDYYSANMEILQNPQNYGFNPNKTTTACCGAPGLGLLNYNPSLTCGHPSKGSNVCANPSEHVNWDGVHFTEQFYRTISAFALYGLYTDQGTNYTDLCNLDFSMFDSKVTYQEVYGSQCDNLFA